MSFFFLEIFSNENLATSKAVCEWVRKLGRDYEKYAKIFEEHDVTGYWLLNQITEQLLEMYGITNALHRRVILDNIEKLKGKSDVTPIFMPGQK